jgi:hypothetical protein
MLAVRLNDPLNLQVTLALRLQLLGEPGPPLVSLAKLPERLSAVALGTAGRWTVVRTGHTRTLRELDAREHPNCAVDQEACAAAWLRVSPDARASHAALVGRGMGRPAVTGAADLDIDLHRR